MEVTDSILNSVKQQLGIIDPTMDVFDPDVTMNINAAIAVLTQLGIGPKEGFVITGPSETYEDFLGNHITQISMVKEYLYVKTKLLFDNSSMTSGLIEEMKSQAQNLEWRLQIQAEYVDKEEAEESK